MTETYTLRGGFKTEDPKLDRLPLKDDASRGYQARAVLAGDVPVSESLLGPPKHYWNPWKGQDQGEEGACCLFGCAHRINGSPIRHKPPLLAPELFGHYHEVQHDDPWAGCRLGPRCPKDPSNEAYEGTAVLSTAKYARKMGWIGSFWWVGAGSGDVGKDIVDVLARWGGIVFGLGWTRSMFYPRPSGLVEVTGDFIGGHSLYGFEHAWRGKLRGEGPKPIDGVWLQQSWGPNHGVSRRGWAGCIFIRLEDLVNKLMLAEGSWSGEGCVYQEAA